MSKYQTLKAHKGIRKNLENGNYLATKNINGKRFNKSFKSLREAKFWRQNFHPQIAPTPKKSKSLLVRQFGNGLDKSITFFDVFEKYKLQKLPTLGEQTRYRKVINVENFMLKLMDVKLCEINSEVIGNLILEKKEETIELNPQRCNFNRDLKEVSSVFDWYRDAIDDTYRNPIKKYHKELGKIKDPPKVNKKITANEFVEFINAFTEKQKLYKDIAIMQFYTAGRIHEVAGILIKNIDLAQRILTIQETVSWVKRQPPKIKPTTKTGETRFVSINDSMLEIINHRISESENGLLFHRKGKILRYNAISRNYNKALEAAGLPYSGTHILRHSMATTTRKLKGLEHAQAVTGHKSQRMLEHYAENDSINLNKESVLSVEKFIEKIKSDAKNATKCDLEECEVVQMPINRG